MSREKTTKKTVSVYSREGEAIDEEEEENENEELQKINKKKQRNNSLSNKSLNSCFNIFFVVQTKNIHSNRLVVIVVILPIHKEFVD